LNLGSCSNLDGVTDVISDETELSYAVIAASVRKDRVSRAVADWVARTALARRPVDLIDLADCPLPPDELLSPRARGAPRSPDASTRPTRSWWSRPSTTTATRRR
jgi:hypothetical protein